MPPPEDPLVSVVMIFRDPVGFFTEAVASVLAQTGVRLELLLCDDGSRASHSDAARALAAEHPAVVRYLDHDQHAHRGMSATRNLGIRAARGDLVAFLDADDRWDAGHLAHEVALLRSRPEAQVVCGRARDWTSWSPQGGADTPSPLPWPAGSLVPAPLMLEAVLRRSDVRTPTCSLLVRREALIEVGGAEDDFRGMYEDQVLLAKLYLRFSCVLSGGTTAWYRRHDGSSTATAVLAGTYHSTDRNPDRLAYLSWLREQLADRPDRTELRRLVDTEMDTYEQAPPGRGRLPPAWGAQARRVARGVARRGVARLPAPWRPAHLVAATRTLPVSRQFGADRGLPIDRHFIEGFLAGNAHLVAGRVLEVGDDAYTRRFGGPRVTSSDVLHVEEGHPGTTLVADLVDAPQIPSDYFDAMIVTQTLHLLYDVAAGVRTLHRVLRPGGTLLATFPGISPLATDRWADTWYWSLTPLAATRVFSQVFGPGNVEVTAHGNVQSSVGFLQGLATDELPQNALTWHDPQFPLLVTVRASRPVEQAP